MSKSTQRGFTLIELVVVIVILGILAAYAVPKFMGLEGQARAATVKSMASSVTSAASMAYGVWAATGLGGANVTINGVAVPVSFGYPTAASVVGLIQDTTGFTVAGAVWTKTAATTPAQCQFTYTPATATTPASVLPASILTNGC